MTRITTAKRERGIIEYNMPKKSPRIFTHKGDTIKERYLVKGRMSKHRVQYERYLHDGLMGFHDPEKMIEVNLRYNDIHFTRMISPGQNINPRKEYQRQYGSKTRTDSVGNNSSGETNTGITISGGTDSGPAIA